MKTGIVTFAEAALSMHPRELDNVLKAAALAVSRSIPHIKSIIRPPRSGTKPLSTSIRHLEWKYGRQLNDPGHYVALAWESYVAGSVKDRTWEINGAGDLVSLLITRAAIFVFREALPNNNKKPPTKSPSVKSKQPRVSFVSLDTLDTKPESENIIISPEIELLRSEQEAHESAVLAGFEFQRASLSEKDERDLLKLIRLLKLDSDAQKTTGNLSLNAKYVAEKLCVPPSRVSTLFSLFKQLCREINDPGLLALIESADFDWLDSRKSTLPDARRSIDDQSSERL